MDEVRFCCFLSSSKRSLFDVTNAISNPEKKAESKSVRSMNEKRPKMLLLYVEQVQR